MGFFSRKKKKPVIGLTLSGGGMRGIGHIAVLKALEEYHLAPNIISGTSAGSVVGAFYSLGKSPEEMMEIVRKGTFFSRTSFQFSKNGIFSPNFIVKLLKTYFDDDDFSCLKIPLHVATTEMTKGNIKFFSEGPLFEILLASSSVPFVFPPVRIGDEVHVDGGVLDNFPIEPLIGNCDILIGSHVNSIGYDELKKLSLIKEFDRILHLAIASSVYAKASTCDIFLDPPGMTKFSLFKKTGIEEMWEIVYDYTCEILEEKGYSKDGVSKPKK